LEYFQSVFLSIFVLTLTSTFSRDMSQTESKPTTKRSQKLYEELVVFGLTNVTLLAPTRYNSKAVRKEPIMWEVISDQYSGGVGYTVTEAMAFIRSGRLKQTIADLRAAEIKRWEDKRLADIATYNKQQQKMREAFLQKMTSR
jgi:hypothetical protein